MLPLFKNYTIDQIHDLTGYSEAYLVDIKAHPSKANAQFRRMVARILNQSEQSLFGE